MSNLQARYEQAKGRLLSDSSITTKNRELFRRFLEFEEYKLKRVNGIPRLESVVRSRACLAIFDNVLIRESLLPPPRDGLNP